MARTVRVYRSTDGSAPTLSGTAGDLINVLDKCLVAGYGAAVAAGWTKPYTGTNLAAFRNSATDGTGSYLRVRDDFTTTNTKAAGLRGFVTMSDVNTGTDPFDVTADNNGIWKSATADATTRAWVIVADNCFFHMFIQNTEVSTDFVYASFGDMFSYKASDAYRAVLTASYGAGATSWAYTANFMRGRLPGTSENSISCPRISAGTGTGIKLGTHTDAVKCGGTGGAAAFGGSSSILSYPYSINSGVLCAPIWLHEAGTAPYIIRGYLPGLWAPMHNRPLSNGDTFTGNGNLAGKTFEAFSFAGGGQLFLETSNTWL